jgi:hypothetical protein
MEKNTIPKRTYQKHKTEYKIGISYKLNKRLKPLSFYNRDCYPLYIEVRAKGKMNFFPSRLGIMLSEKGLSDFSNSEIGNLFINQECNRIKKSIITFFEENDSLTLSNWYEIYSKEILNNSVLQYANTLFANRINRLIEEKATDDETINYFTFLNEGLRMNYTDYGSLVELFSFLGFAKLENIREFSTLSQIVVDNSMALEFDFNVVGSITGFFTIQDIQDGFYEKLINDYYHDNPHIPSKMLKIDVINYLNKFKDKLLELDIFLKNIC